MAGGYAEQKSAPKSLVSSNDIAPGAIQLQHLDAGLFAEMQGIRLHSHTGAKSRRVNLKDLEGSFGIGGFYMYSSDGTKRYRVTINSGTGAFVLTEVT